MEEKKFKKIKCWLTVSPLGEFVDCLKNEPKRGVRCIVKIEYSKTYKDHLVWYFCENPCTEKVEPDDEEIDEILIPDYDYDKLE